MPDIFIEPTHTLEKESIPLKEGAPRKNTVGMFSTFCHNPHGITFANQETGEEIILFLRRHFATNIPWIANTFFLILLPAVLLIVTSFTKLQLPFVPFGLMLVLVAFYYLLIVGYVLSKFIAWFYNVGIITQKRVIDVDSSNILSQEVATTNISGIVDAEYTQRGFFQSFFNYGDVELQTEGIKPNFEFNASPNPAKVTDIIQTLKIEAGGGKL